ncbi:sugar transferase [Myroides odoratimimus]|uniref:sugar transferase n=1 Tax=Myroides odoratimimus TaxID=76832 RepID=UPI002575F326|nr:sugar transferase [Myroides odoratimimus]MDM1415681.1 sugar transferase [Myroides odoratimimus]
MYQYFFKRIIDFFISLIGLILLSPIILIVMLCLFVVNNGKPFFFQVRPGKNERVFKIIKFKTMNDKKDEEGNLLTDVERLTKIGKFVRKTSLDEIPQLINVLKGDMSLIGPRPLLPEYLEYYSDYHKRRHEVRPGITGLAQVRGRNMMKFSERFNNDVYYVDNLSFLLDMKIILWTIKAVLFKSSMIVNGQSVDDIDDLGITKKLSKNHFVNNKK